MVIAKSVPMFNLEVLGFLIVSIGFAYPILIYVLKESRNEHKDFSFLLYLNQLTIFKFSVCLTGPWTLIHFVTGDLVFLQLQNLEYHVRVIAIAAFLNIIIIGLSQFNLNIRKFGYIYLIAFVAMVVNFLIKMELLVISGVTE